MSDCLDCEGHGYAAFMCDAPHHPGAELQRCDSCGRFADDKAACFRFVMDLEKGSAYAQEHARFLIEHGAPVAGEEGN